MSFSLEGKTAVVTGAGRGIGRAIATRLADAGASVMLNDLEPGPLSETCQALTSAGHQIRAFAGDLTKPSFPDELVKETLDRFGAIDIIVNNAGYILGQCRAKDDRRAVPGDARHSSGRAVPHGSAQPPSTSGRRRKARSPRDAA